MCVKGGVKISDVTNVEKKNKLSVKVMIALISVIGAAFALMLLTSDMSLAYGAGVEDTVQTSQYGKHLDIWFMTFMIAILMMFIKKFEWGVAVAVLLSAAATYVTYFGILQFLEPEFAWTQVNLIRGAVASITVVIAVGCFVGTVKNWQYILVGVLFAPVYYAIEWLCGYFGEILLTNTGSIMDPGGAILVHMCAAYFGLGVIMALKDKRVFDEPMHSTKHSFTFAWLASMMLFMLWPSFVTALLEPEQMVNSVAVCYMAGMGSILSAYVTGTLIEGKVNPGIYAFALLAGPVSMSAIMLEISPFFALLWGAIGGVIVTLSFLYLQPWLCEKIGAVDIMGVHNLHGVAGWFGVIGLLVITMDLSVLWYPLAMMAITIVTGFAIGLLLKYTRGQMDYIMDDRLEFVFNEDPENPETPPLPQAEN